MEEEKINEQVNEAQETVEIPNENKEEEVTVCENCGNAPCTCEGTKSEAIPIGSMPEVPKPESTKEEESFIDKAKDVVEEVVEKVEEVAHEVAEKASEMFHKQNEKQNKEEIVIDNTEIPIKKEPSTNEELIKEPSMEEKSKSLEEDVKEEKDTLDKAEELLEDIEEELKHEEQNKIE